MDHLLRSVPSLLLQLRGRLVILLDIRQLTQLHLLTNRDEDTSPRAARFLVMQLAEEMGAVPFSREPSAYDF